MFRFWTPEYLYILALLPLLTVVFIFSLRNRKRRVCRFGNPELVAELMPDYSSRRTRNKFIFFLIALGLLIVAAARPQSGSKLREVSREGMEIMFAIDVSNSMLAQDFEPSRLERTKYAVNQVLEGITEDKVGVIVFAGDAYVQLPITSDYLTARTFVSQISPGMVSMQGTAIGAAISLATSSFSSASGTSRSIVLITDGENHEDNAFAAAERAAENGIKIYAIGIGTPEGAPIRIGEDFIRDEAGEIVVSKLDEVTLQAIAVSTGGAYIRSDNHSVGITEIIESINNTEKTELSALVFEEYDEHFQYFLGASLISLLIGFVLLPRRNKLLAKYNIFSTEAPD